jgi:hypothetical protein
VESRKTWKIIIIVAAALAAGTLAVLLNIRTEEVVEGVEARLFFGSLSTDEAARLLGLAEEARAAGDLERALGLVTYAYTRHDEELVDDLMLLWGRILLEQDKADEAVEVLRRLIDDHPAGDVIGDDLLGPQLYAVAEASSSTDSIDYALTVKLAGLARRADSAALERFQTLMDGWLARDFDLEWTYEHQGEMEYHSRSTARSDVGAAEHEAELRAPGRFAAELSTVLNLGPPPGEEEPLVSEPKLAEYLTLTERITVEVRGTEVEEIEPEEDEEEDAEDAEPAANDEDEEEDDWLTEHLAEGMTEEEAALLREVLSATPTPEDRASYRAVTRVDCRLEGFSLGELFEHLGLEPYTGRPALPGSQLPPEEDGE